MSNVCWVVEWTDVIVLKDSITLKLVSLASDWSQSDHGKGDGAK